MSTVDQAMLPAVDESERVDLINNIKSQWKLSDPTYLLSQDTRNPDSMITWPLHILRAIGRLANGMPGVAGRDQFQSLLKHDQLTRAVLLPAHLQMSDLDQIREFAGLESFAGIVEDKGDESRFDADQDTEDTDSETIGPIHQQGNDSNTFGQHRSRLLPSPISPGDDLETLIIKWHRWIEYYWDVPDARDIVPSDLRKLAPSGLPIRLSLQGYDKSADRRGDMPRSMYLLARITQDRKDEAWEEIQRRWELRSAGSGKRKVLANTDVRATLDHFRLLREDQEDPYTDTSGQLPLPASNFNEADGEEGEYSTMAVQRAILHLEEADRESEHDRLARDNLELFTETWAMFLQMPDAPHDDEAES